MNTQLSAANAARTTKALEAKINLNGTILTKADWLRDLKSKGGTASTCKRAKYQYSRTKYNRMNGWEQAAYEKKCAETINGWRIDLPNETSFAVTETEYNYFLSLEQSI